MMNLKISGKNKVAISNIVLRQNSDSLERTRERFKRSKEKKKQKDKRNHLLLLEFTIWTSTKSSQNPEQFLI
jgi:hypothetical protein